MVFLQFSPSHIDWYTLRQPIWRTRNAFVEPNMLSAVRMTAMSRARYPALPHFGGTVLLQVAEEDGSLLHQILVAYQRLTCRVALINTSLNGGDEPMVETQAQACPYAAAIGLDYFYTQGTVEYVHA